MEPGEEAGGVDEEEEKATFHDMVEQAGRVAGLECQRKVEDVPVCKFTQRSNSEEAASAAMKERAGGGYSPGSLLSLPEASRHRARASAPADDLAKETTHVKKREAALRTMQE